MKVMPKGATQQGLEKASKRSELFKKTRALREGLAVSLPRPALEEYEQSILATSPRRRKSA